MQHYRKRCLIAHVQLMKFKIERKELTYSSLKHGKISSEGQIAISI
jgi:hypothetical protein